MIRRLLFLYAFLLPYEELLGGSWAVKPYRLTGFVLLFLWTTGVVIPRMHLRLDLFDRVFFFIFYLGLFTAAFWYVVTGKGNVSWALGDFALFFFVFLVYLAIKDEVRSFQDIAALMRPYVMGTVSSVVVYAVLVESPTNGRFEAFDANPNRLAVAVGVSLFFIVAQFLFVKKTRTGLRLVLYGTSFLVLSASLLFTGSFGALAGIAAGAVVLALLGTRQALGTRASLSAGRLIAFVALIVLGTAILSNLFTRYSDESSAIYRYQLGVSHASRSRLDILQTSWNVAQDHYLLGPGLGEYRYYHREYIAKLSNVRDIAIADQDLVAHDDYLDQLNSSGFFGLVMFVALLVILARALFRKLGDRNAPYSLSVFLIVSLTFLCVDGGSHILLRSPDYWFLLALMTAYIRLRPDSPTQAKRRAVAELPTSSTRSLDTA